MEKSSKGSNRDRIYVSILVIGSIVISLLTVEVALRILAPERYQGARMLTSVPDNTKMWAPPTDTVQYFRHPDTGDRITLLRNNLGLRMNNDVSGSTLKTTTNVAFFGASFTENIRLATEHTFPEVLKHLLNVSDRKFEVLNFGVGGYGLDQSYLRYHELTPDIRNELDLVVLLISPENIWDPAPRKIGALDKDEELVVTPRGPRIPPFVKAVTQLYITYFLMDVYDLILSTPQRNIKMEREIAKKTKKKAKKVMPERDKAVKLFNALMLQWQTEVEASGGKFRIATIPYHDYWSVEENLDSRLSAIDLHELVVKFVPDDQLPQLSFQNDGHWSEAGNLVAAVTLSQALGPEFTLPRMDDATLVEQLRSYYQSFPVAWQPRQVGSLSFTKMSSDNN